MLPEVENERGHYTNCPKFFWITREKSIRKEKKNKRKGEEEKERKRDGEKKRNGK